MMIRVKAPNMTTGNIADIMYTVLQAQQILEVRDIGCTVYD